MGSLLDLSQSLATALTLVGGSWTGERAIDHMMSLFRVMVVGDDDALRAALAPPFRLEGYAVDKATEGPRPWRTSPRSERTWWSWM